MSFPRYPDYKDSGVEWLGEVPGHWATPPLYLRYSVELGKMLDSSRITGDHLVPYLRNVDVQWGRINFDDLPEMDIEASEYGRYTVAPGDLLVCEGGEVGRAAIVPERSSTIGFQKALHRLRALADDEHPAFMYFTLSWAALRGVFNQGGLSTIAHLTGEQLRKYRFPKPPITEQARIAAFLDRETAKIDALVAEQQNLIALLKEKRQALISHAVTKGLDPDVRMKDSGVAWLGEVPAHWLISPLKYLASSIKAGPFGSALTKDMYVASGYRVYGQEQVIPGDFTVGDYYISDGVFDELSQYAVAPGDLLISCVGTFGKIAIVPDDVEPGIINPRLIRLRVRSDVKAGFLCEVLRSQVVFEQFAVLSRGGTMDVINIGTLSNIYVPCPPFEEQQRILSFLADSLMEIDSLVAEADATIALLKERRTALISAAVTGKIDVRHLSVASTVPTPEPA
ncbi:MAG TPA: restriction endonuclease subunit S [Thauera phenylacetica]|jgi:type I restriction enzyme S subunit|nr:restriction endonuclease subunit S [Thauera phenylacetica]